MGKKKGKSAATAAAAVPPQQQPQKQQQSQRVQATSASDASSGSDSCASPSPVAAASSSSKFSAPSAPHSQTSSAKNNKKAHSKAAALTPHATTLPPAFGDVEPARSDIFTRGKDGKWIVPDEAYLESLLPKNSWKRTLRRLGWKWKIHFVETMFEPFEAYILTISVATIAVGVATYTASTIAGMVL